MNFLFFGIILIEFCSASRCRREKDRIKELNHQKRELQIERDELAAEKGRFCNECYDEIDELNAIIEKLKQENEELKNKLEDALETSSTEIAPIKNSDVFILVIPSSIDGSYLQSGEGTSQISATINAPENDYAYHAAHALVNGELHIFGGWTDGYKIARLDDCSFNKLPARLNEYRRIGHAALSIENGQKALVCFGLGDSLKSCEIFDGSSTAPTFVADWTHRSGGLKLFQNQPATVGCFNAKSQKAETLSATGWTALPDHPRKISWHSLVGLENGAMLLLGGYDWGSLTEQTGIWELKEEQWSRIGEFSKPASHGSAIYVSRSVYYFESRRSAIYRLDLDENEELEAVEEIGSQPGRNYFPVLFQTDNDYCT